MNTIDYIPQIPLFHGLSRAHLENLSSIARERAYQLGETIFLEGCESTGFFVIISGKVKIYKLSADGKQQILHFFSQGDPFGEVSVFAGERFPAYAEAVEATRVLFFPRDSFVSLIKKDPDLSLNMLAMLSQRLHKFTRLIEDLALKEVPGRLAAYFLFLRENGNGTSKLSLDISKGQLASLLGTIPETLSRILKKMIKHELIKTDGRRMVEILDQKGLEELASGDRHLP